MKKEIIKPTNAFIKHIEEAETMEMICIVAKDKRPSEWFTIQELTTMYPEYKAQYVMLLRSTDAEFPHPIGVMVGHTGGLAYLYSRSDYTKFITNRSGDRQTRAIRRARRLEAEAGRIRYRLKQQGFNVRVSEGHKYSHKYNSKNKGAK